MAQYVTGLVGPGKGPRVRVPAGKASVFLTGFGVGNVLITHEQDDKWAVLLVPADRQRREQQVALPEGTRWASFEYQGGPDNVVCMIRVE